MEQIKKTHGGARAGAGRKAKYEKMIAMKVPEQYKACIKELIQHLDETAHINKDFSQVVSEGVYIRSLKDKKQIIKFITEPK